MSATRPIALDELHDAVAELAQLEISDPELTRLGIPLNDREVLWEGLGPSAYTVVDAGGGARFILHRLDYEPELATAAPGSGASSARELSRPQARAGVRPLRRPAEHRTRTAARPRSSRA